MDTLLEFLVMGTIPGTDITVHFRVFVDMLLAAAAGILTYSFLNYRARRHGK